MNIPDTPTLTPTLTPINCFILLTPSNVLTPLSVLCYAMLCYASSVYMRNPGQPFYPIFPSFFLKLKNQDHFSKSLKNLKNTFRYIIQLLHHHHMIYL